MELGWCFVYGFEFAVRKYKTKFIENKKLKKKRETETGCFWLVS